MLIGHLDEQVGFVGPVPKLGPHRRPQHLVLGRVMNGQVSAERRPAGT
jgi:hypothetical protein